MKIVHKIILVSVFDTILIAATGLMAYMELDMVLTKLRFVEIAEELNASFLETRLSEKNYFLYHDPAVFNAIKDKIETSMTTLAAEEKNIVNAVGQIQFRELEANLKTYYQLFGEGAHQDLTQAGVQDRIRAAGQKLQMFSREITQYERKRIQEIIASSRTGLFYLLCLILISAIGANRLISHKMLKSLKHIEKAALRVSDGNCTEIEAEVSRDELGSVVKAINSMCRELRNRENIIVESKKLASIGILTAGVAHEMGNPLNNISMLAQVYQELYEGLSDEERIEYMKKVEEETERIKEIVRNLLDFSKPKEPNLKQVTANEVIRHSLKLAQNMIFINNIDVHLDLQEDLPPVFIDTYQITEVLINLITNAVQAGSSGDALTLKTGFGKNGDCVLIEVCDTGPGIPPELLPHVFDPFFTTKGTSGTGLGLFVSYGIIKNHRGNMSVTSKLGEGTCFRIELPLGPENGGA